MKATSFFGTAIFLAAACVPASSAQTDSNGSAQPGIVQGALPWISSSDYPPAALREQREGHVRYKLTINPPGRVIDCQIVASSGHADLDERTCLLLYRRARFVEEKGFGGPRFFEGALAWETPKQMQRPAPASKSATHYAQPRPGGGVSQWLSNDDYPMAAAREGRQGRAGFRLTVDPYGRVTDCQITASSGHGDLDSQTCRMLIRRARFVEQSSNDPRYFESSFLWSAPR